MDRFFAKLELGKAVRRFNWNVTTSSELYLQEGNHLYADGKTKAESGAESAFSSDESILDANSTRLEEIFEQEKKEVKVKDCRLRCERQTLHRMPKSKAIVFGFKTYQYRLEDIKAEGNGPALAEAIEGMKIGSVPDMHYYKRGIVWGEPVQEYLRN